MNLNEIREYAYELFALYGMAEWRFQFNERKRTLGLCRFRNKTIEMSRYFAVRADEKDIIDTIRHEIAHALVGPGHGHDAVWRAKAREVGATPRACADTTVTGTDISEGAKWIAHCACGVKHYKFRKPKRLEGWTCRKANQPIKWVPNI